MAPLTKNPRPSAHVCTETADKNNDGVLQFDEFLAGVFPIIQELDSDIDAKIQERALKRSQSKAKLKSGGAGIGGGGSEQRRRSDLLPPPPLAAAAADDDDIDIDGRLMMQGGQRPVTAPDSYERVMSPMPDMLPRAASAGMVLGIDKEIRRLHSHDVLIRQYGMQNLLSRARRGIRMDRVIDEILDRTTEDDFLMRGFAVSGLTRLGVESQIKDHVVEALVSRSCSSLSIHPHTLVCTAM